MYQDPNQSYGQPGEQSGYRGGYRPSDDSQQAGGYGQEQSRPAGQAQGWQTYNTRSSHGPTALKFAPAISAALSYVLGWITGLVFLVLERRNRFIRFHAMQSILVSVALTVVWAVARLIFALPLIGGALGCVLTPALAVATFLVWGGLIVLALLGKETRVPILGDLAARFSSQDQTT
jgi:uncharacterized membrane protein